MTSFNSDTLYQITFPTQVVNGGPLPPRYIHTPYSSFTAGGLVTDMPDGRPASEEVYPLSEVTGAVQELLEEEIGEGVGELAQECVEEVREGGRGR